LKKPTDGTVDTADLRVLRRRRPRRGLPLRRRQPYPFGVGLGLAGAGRDRTEPPRSLLGPLLSPARQALTLRRRDPPPLPDLLR